MQYGFLEAVDANKARLMTANGQRITVNRFDVFKSITPEAPRTVRTDGSNYFSEYTRPKFILEESPSGIVREFLNGAARVSSAPDFSKKSHIQQLETLQSYLLTFVKYENWAKTAEIMGPKNYHELICTGGGVCRHQADLLAAIFSESGFKVRRVGSSRYSNPDESHAWLEVDLFENGGRTTFVVDPANKTVKPLNESMKHAASDTHSLDARWWANPKRDVNDYDTEATSQRAGQSNHISHSFAREAIEKYPVTELDSMYKGEENRSVIPGIRSEAKVTYLNDQEREKYRIVVDNGKLFSSAGRPIAGNGETYIYVMDRFGNFYISTEQAFASFHHSSFLAGAPVAAAGELKIKSGRIVEINRKSGHYRPSNTALDSALTELSKHGVDLNAVRVDRSTGQVTGD